MHATVVQTPDGFSVLGHIEHEGRTYTAGGGGVSDTHAYVYPSAVATPAPVGYRTLAERYSIGTWDGAIPGAVVTRRTEYRQWNPFSGRHETRVCWRFRLADGREYAGRNSGEGMLLRARRVQQAKGKVTA